MKGGLDPALELLRRAKLALRGGEPKRAFCLRATRVAKWKRPVLVLERHTFSEEEKVIESLLEKGAFKGKSGIEC
jgi:hypothetical protein